MTDRPTVDEVRVGDTMRVSVELIKQWAEEGRGYSEVVKLVRVEVESDGTKTLWLEKER